MQNGKVAWLNAMGQNPGGSGFFTFHLSQTIDNYPKCLIVVDSIDMGNCPLQEMWGGIHKVKPVLQMLTIWDYDLNDIWDIFFTYCYEYAVMLW